MRPYYLRGSRQRCSSFDGKHHHTRSSSWWKKCMHPPVCAILPPAHTHGYVVHQLSGKRAHTLDAIGLKLCSLSSPMLSLLTQALEVWRKVQLHVEPPDWIRISFCCPYLLHTHRADLCNLLRQEGEHRPRVSILALIDEGWVARLWCLLKRSPDLAAAPLHNAPLAYPLHAVADTKNSECAMAVSCSC